MKPKMVCPSCGGTLRHVKVDEIGVEVCKGGCGGIWFDRFELPLMDEPHEVSDEALLDLLAIDSTASTRADGRRCPRCAGTVMMQGFYSGTARVVVDRCPRCFGYWLDETELIEIRQQAEPRQVAETPPPNAAVRFLTRLVSVIQHLTAGRSPAATRRKKP